MLCLNLQSTDPYFNLASEEFLLRNKSEDYLLLYVNSPSVIIGKHQAAHRETNTRYVFENHIPVIRRISGGGTVYHDAGNLNFSFISQSSSGKQVDFRKYTLPVIEFLDNLGIEAVFAGKNDLRVNGLKISGNAEHVFRERVLHHGTLLFESDMDSLGNSIRRDLTNYTTRAVNSNPATVMNLRGILPGINNMDQLRDTMLKYFLDKSETNTEVSLRHEEIQEINSAADSKYRSWEWNFAYGPEYTFTNRFESEGQDHKCELVVKNGIIVSCVISGSERMGIASKKLLGCRHMVIEMSEILTGEGIIKNESDIFNFF